MGHDDSTKKRPASGQARNPIRERHSVTAAGPEPPGLLERVARPPAVSHDRRRPKRVNTRPRRYIVAVLGDLPADLGDRVAGLHAAAIQGRDDPSEPSDVLVEPDDGPSASVRRTPALNA